MHLYAQTQIQTHVNTGSCLLKLAGHFFIITIAHLQTGIRNVGDTSIDKYLFTSQTQSYSFKNENIDWCHKIVNQFNSLIDKFVFISDKFVNETIIFFLSQI